VRRTRRVLAVLAVGMFVAAIPVMAQRPSAPAASEGQVYDFADIWKGVTDRVVPLPSVSDPTPGAASVGPKEAGPILAQPSMSAVAGISPRLGGSAIPTMGAGAILTPMERTGLGIKRLIRQLG